MMNIEKLDWDSDLFGYPVAKITAMDGPLSCQEIACQLSAAGIRLGYVATESKQPHLRACHVVDQVTWELPVNVRDRGTQVRHYSVESYPCMQPDGDLIGLAMQAGVSSRFRLDPRFGDADFKRLYEIWITRSCLREIADAVIVVKDLGQFCGLVTGMRLDSSYKIGLIAVSNAYRRRGIGRNLLAAIENRASELGCMTVNVVTQSVNHAAMNLYMSFGFRKSITQHWYHIWAD